ncbi:MAG TPA: dephospho-CoA kinase [Bacteroidales bacterium]|nr:dephospho-CoA kinase [Bacteroidales bacterium]
MLKIGLTGNIGSGKTTIARIFEIIGVQVFYADTCARNVLNSTELTPELLLNFGETIIGADGLVDRKVLASIVFNDEQKLVTLNTMVHPKVRSKFHEWIHQKSHQDYVVLEAAILFETGYASQFDKIIAVVAPMEQRMSRVVERDHAQPDEVLKRMQHQMPEETIMELADFVIQNNNHQLVMPQVLEIDKILRDLSHCK